MCTIAVTADRILQNTSTDALYFLEIAYSTITVNE